MLLLVRESPRNVRNGRCTAAGLLATTVIKQVANRGVLERISEVGRLFFVVSDRKWFDSGVAIRIAIIAFDRGDCSVPILLDGKNVSHINIDLSSGCDLSSKQRLPANLQRCFMGTTKVGDFDIGSQQASDSWSTLTQMADRIVMSSAPSEMGVIWFGYPPTDGLWILELASNVRMQHYMLHRLNIWSRSVKPVREQNNDRWRSQHWWLLGRTIPDFRKAVTGKCRYIGTPRVAKHRIFVWLDGVILPDSKVIAIALDDAYSFGVLHSKIHEVWTIANCGWHGVGKDATYNPTTCFETFPSPNRPMTSETQ